MKSKYYSKRGKSMKMKVLKTVSTMVLTLILGASVLAGNVQAADGYITNVIYAA